MTPNLNELPSPQNHKTGWPWFIESPPLDSNKEGIIWPKVSVVTPSYNQGEFLEESIRSVLLQSYPNLEYIIIDGGSTDESVEIIRKYAPWLTYWVSEKDNGQSDAINKGWHKASGVIWAWLNSDDVYMPGAIHEAVQLLIRYPDVGLVYGDAVMIDQLGNDLAVHRSQLRSIRHHIFRLENDLPYNVPQPTTFFIADFVKRVGYINTELYYAMDYDLFLRLTELGSSAYLPRVQAKMRLYEGTKTSTNIRENWKEKLSVMKKYHKLWYLSPIWLRYLRFRCWEILPSPLKNQIRNLRKSPRDIVFLKENSN